MTKDMKWLCSARNRADVEQVRDKLLAAGIACEVRDYQTNTQPTKAPSYPELWIRGSSDYHTASILYASPVELLRRRSGTGK